MHNFKTLKIKIQARDILKKKKKTIQNLGNWFEEARRHNEPATSTKKYRSAVLFKKKWKCRRNSDKKASMSVYSIMSLWQHPCHHLDNQSKKKKSASATADAVTFLTCPPNERKLPQKPIAKQCAKLLPITSFIQATKTQQTSASIEPTPWLKIGRQFLAYEWSDITEKQDGRLLAFSLPLKLGYIWATALVQRPNQSHPIYSVFWLKTSRHRGLLFMIFMQPTTKPGCNY